MAAHPDGYLLGSHHRPPRGLTLRSIADAFMISDLGFTPRIDHHYDLVGVRAG
jgi:hypothetical protein